MRARHLGHLGARFDLAVTLGCAALFATSVADAESQPDETGDDSAAIEERSRERAPRRRRVPPASADDAEFPDVEVAMREAPPRPTASIRYRGSDAVMEAAEVVRRRARVFMNYRAATPLATWRDNPAFEWRVRRARACHAELRRLGVGFVPYEVENIDADGNEEEALDPFPTPAPIVLKSRVNDVRIVAASGEALMSCELASRLPVLAKVAARHGVTRIMLSSLYRPGPAPSFHTFGMAMDIHRMQVEEPLTGPAGTEPSRWLTVATDFVETPNTETCDPSLLEAGALHLGDNERGRRLLTFICELFDSGVFSTVLTPNYNEGHRGHFHVDIRPDDPRTFLR